MQKKKKCSVYENRLKNIVLSVYKIINDIMKPVSKDFYRYKRNGYNLRNNCVLERPNVNTTRYGLHSLRYEGVVLWERIPLCVQSAPSHKLFKENFKKIKLSDFQ